MSFTIDLPTLIGAGANWFTNIIDFGIRATLILAAAWFLTSVFMRRFNPEARHRVWSLSFTLVILLPFVVGFVLPLIRIPLITAFWNVQPSPEKLSLIGQLGNTGDLFLLLEAWPALFLLAWICFSSFFLLRHLVGLCASHRISRSSSQRFSSEKQMLFNELIQDMGLRRSVRLVRSTIVRTPMTSGAITPFIAMPASAESWPAERFRAVCIHELAHVKRWDYFTKLITVIAKAFFWFTPMVWIAQRRMQDEMERACDEQVLASGVKPSDYALGLATLARQARQPVGVATALSMSSSSRAFLLKRLKAILEPDSRRQKTRMPALAAAASLLMLFSLPAFVLQPFNYITSCSSGKQAEKTLNEWEKPDPEGCDSAQSEQCPDRQRT